MINIILIFIIFYFVFNIKYDCKFIEKWRDLPYIGNKDMVTYNNINTRLYSRKNLPVYYPISSPLEDNFNNINSITSPKLSMFRSVLRQVYLSTNQSIEPIVFNYTNRPIEHKKIESNRINSLASLIINSINKFGYPILQVKLIKTLNEVHEETEEQSRIKFDIKLELIYKDSENLGRDVKNDILYIQQEFIFEKINKTLDEDTFFDKLKKVDFRIYLSQLLVIGAEHNGFLSGR